MNTQEIIKKLNLEQKCALLSGATTFGTRALPKNNIPSITLSDGPNGVRKQAGAADHLGLNPSVPATCFPTAATVACSWDPALCEQIGQAMGEEAAAQEVAVLLGPGLNTKRSPLCGRDFEYFSEDPYLAGKMAAGYVRGIQSNGISACPKHFAVNSQELRRMASDSVVDERTLRELYLTGFEIVVKEAHPKTIMSTMPVSQRQMVEIAKAVSLAAKLIIVDEPTTGLDPEERIRFRNILSDISDKDSIIILSTHIVGDISSTCNCMALMNKGEVSFYGSPQDMLRQAEGKVWRIRVTSDELHEVDKLYPVISTIPSGTGWEVQVVADEVQGYDAESYPPNLEHAYVYYMENKLNRWRND